jgi:prepilin-type N-terminal cleavage/methylation domain-containing protein
VGFTLPEVLVSMLLFGISVLAIGGVLALQGAFGRETVRSEAADGGRLAVQQLERDIRFADSFSDPLSSEAAANPTGDPSGLQLVMSTRESPTRENPAPECVQWRVTTDTHELLRRAWHSDAIGDPVDVSGWRVIADDVVNGDPTLTGTNSTIPAFRLDHSQAAVGNRLIELTILTPAASGSGDAVRIEDLVSGRNSGFVGASTRCRALPRG